MRTQSLICSIVLCISVSMVMGASCQTQVAVDRIRQVHSGIRQAFVEVDEYVAPKFAEAGSRCIEQSSSAEESDECMRKWLRIDEVLVMSRESLAELENIYNNIEAGVAGETSWQYWALQVLAHGRAIVRILSELELGDADPIIHGMHNALDQICQIAQCEGGA